MEDPRPESLETVAARVVAWHNRHPLARRIRAEQVQSVGFVALPYAAPAGVEPAGAAAPAAAADPADAPAGGTLRERAAARAKPGAAPAAAAPGPAATPGKSAKAGARRRGLKAAFTEDFIAPLSPRRVARWAARHAVPLDQAPRGAPLRQVEPDAALAAKAGALQTLYVQTAMVESRGKRVRMLLSPSSDTAVLGSRLWSPPRVAGGAVGALGGLAAAGLALALWWQPPALPEAPPLAAAGTVTQAQAPAPAHAERPASAASLPSIKPASMRAAAQADAEATHSAALPDPAASGAAAAEPPPAAPPLDVEPRLGRINLPPLGLPHGDEARAAARERRLAQQAPVTASTAPAVAPAGPAAVQAATTAAPAAPATAPAAVAMAPAPAAPVAVATTAPAATAPPAPATPPAPQAAAAPAAGQAFALSSRRLRTRAETEQTVAAVRALLAGAGHSGVQVEMMPAGDDWRIVSWPFGQRAQAEQARTLLASRGIRLEVVAF